MAPTLTSFVNSFTNRLETPLRQHLKNVYGCLALSSVTAGIGSYVHIYTDILQAGLLSTLGALGLLIALGMTPDNGKNQKLRLGYLLGFAFLSGLGLGPLLEIVISIDPSIIVTALVGKYLYIITSCCTCRYPGYIYFFLHNSFMQRTTVVFTSFSISSLYAQRGQWLYLSGTLISLSNITIILLLANIFLRSALVYQAQLYLGLALMCGFIIFDTQLIVEKFHMGSKDFIGHSLELFIDFFRVFRYLVEILAIKEQNNRKRKE
ncbi:Similar to tmbim6: Probable Bax inhibitor 1 (Paralichthys olivaceus) [Cotesia congregata]|uniref:Similar to tmbim6: Probable Bax inhibitor 1 (Paralichthys olivaceus) n=1 Tax=Cotesia congregata TaxID=51543 RepID=A0A8J2HRX8_COTCN|nr:Similar to tmbim6: Probable Bax inhibitor 1 (Paralichthys olivaceus) [Cotesia congregata]